VRQSFGPYAQGPAGVLARFGDTIVASVDALGLRPLWYIETEKEHIFSSERGAVPLEVMVADPRALGPGEKMAIRLDRGASPKILTHSEIRQHVVNRAFQREAPQLARQYWTAWENSDWGRPGGRPSISEIQLRIGEPEQEPCADREVPPLEIPWYSAATDPLEPYFFAANGWNQAHFQGIDDAVFDDKDIGSLGYDGPLAALSRRRVNVADFYKETVAVVTNPAIDRGREVEVFSTSSLFGACPRIGKAPDPNDRLVTLKIPILTGGHPLLGDPAEARALAEAIGSHTVEDLLEIFNGRVAWLVLGVFPGEDVRNALERLAEQAAAAIENGAQCLALDDSPIYEQGLGWLDPLLAVSRVDEALRTVSCAHKESVRRKVGIVVRSAAIRNLHDVALLLGFGADAVNPYGIFVAVAQRALTKKRGVDDNPRRAQQRMLDYLKAGLEKVISTMGCHELRGYGRVCSSIGLAPGVAKVLRAPNYLGSDTAGLTWERLARESSARGKELVEKKPGSTLEYDDHFFPKMWKKVGSFTRSQVGYDEVLETFGALKKEVPVALRHVIGFKNERGAVMPSQVDLSIRDYSLPFVISAMSFGSQGEISFRTYARAAELLNIICINGEGGELSDIMGVYKKNRGQQVASGRFGVNSQFLNSAAVLEIKIGQGAKPGEGGMLPGFKVTPVVAEARRTPPFVSLLSPSNNHDLYSIEDLAQLIEELKVVNPLAKVSVKCPVVPGIGVIAVGIAKAGADIINLSGYDGGTGAARKHSLQYVGLPAEIGVIQAHRALVEAGLRHKVEIWCDGGMKTGEDVVKMVLLGANRVGFGTMAMVAIGCTICRKCEEGTCLVGITTQVRTAEEAHVKGFKAFTPLDYETAVDRLVRLFRGMEDEIRRIVGKLNAKNLQDLVGRGDLLAQVSHQEQIDLTSMFESVPIRAKPELEPGVGRLLVRPRNNLTRLLSELITETIMEDDEREITYQDSVMAIDRALGAHIVGALSRSPEVQQRVDRLHLRFGPSSIAGNGFSAWVSDPLDVIIEGGAQDGTAKGAAGGRVAVMKGINHEGLHIDGSVGKSFAYGAQKGLLIVQGNADSRACIRLSGADVVLGGEITQPVTAESLTTATQANLKGFACEYMTSGHVVILGDPGPYAFSGMTGGRVYQMLTPELGFNQPALERRVAMGAQIEIQSVDAEDVLEIQRLLAEYAEALEQTYQYDTAERIKLLAVEGEILERFVKIVPMPASQVLASVAVMAEDMSE
jgi:glutamate synthase (NADPH/NADH) large chain